MKIDTKKSPLENLNTDVLVIFVAQKSSRDGEKTKAPKSTLKAALKLTKDEKKPAASKAYVEGVSKAIQARIQTSIDDGSISGSANETVLFRDASVAGSRHLLAIGLGDQKSFNHEKLRQAAASMVSALKSTKVKTVSVALDTLPHNSLSADLTVQALTEGALLADYSYSELKESKDAARGLETITIVSTHKSKTYDNGLEIGTVLAECVSFARRLGDAPGNYMTPTILAEETLKAAKGTKLKVTVWDRAKIKQEKMGSFLSVSNGSAEPPKFIAMEYNGASTSKKPVCLVGKGLTFDCGGISIKPSAGMEEMKYDMCGGANVIAAMVAIARLKLKINAIAFVPSTENLVGPAATKPGDVVVARNGKSIEVNNTDAEGRLILADALVWASEQDPAMILDAATLTGAMVVALGNIHTGFFTRNDKLARQVEDAADATGELVWRMPLTDYHVKDMKGTYADLSNMSSAKGAGSATAAAFLEHFVAKDIPWVHFDIAGTAWHAGDRLSYCPRKGATGAMVRTFVEMAKNLG